MSLPTSSTPPSKKAAERQLITHRDDIQRLNADLEQKVADRTNALMNTLDQLKQSKDELTKALAAEQRLSELKSRFVSMASHEFRTPQARSGYLRHYDAGAGWLRGAAHFQ